MTTLEAEARCLILNCPWRDRDPNPSLLHDRATIHEGSHKPPHLVKLIVHTDEDCRCEAHSFREPRRDRFTVLLEVCDCCGLSSDSQAHLEHCRG